MTRKDVIGKRRVKSQEKLSSIGCWLSDFNHWSLSVVEMTNNPLITYEISHFVTNDIFSQSYYQLVDSMTEKHCFGMTLLVMSSPFK